MLLTPENILRHGDFELDRYHLREPDYRLQDVNQHEVLILSTRYADFIGSVRGADASPRGFRY